MSCPGIRTPAIATLLAIITFNQLVLVARPLALPNRPEPLKSAVIGDNGTGGQPEYAVAAQMIAAHKSSSFDLVMIRAGRFA